MKNYICNSSAVHVYFFIELENVSLSFDIIAIYIVVFPSPGTSIMCRTAEICMCFFIYFFYCSIFFFCTNGFLFLPFFSLSLEYFSKTRVKNKGDNITKPTKKWHHSWCKLRGSNDFDCPSLFFLFCFIFFNALFYFYILGFPTTWHTCPYDKRKQKSDKLERKANMRVERQTRDRTMTRSEKYDGKPA